MFWSRSPLARSQTNSLLLSPKHACNSEQTVNKDRERTVNKHRHSPPPRIQLQEVSWPTTASANSQCCQVATACVRSRAGTFGSANSAPSRSSPELGRWQRPCCKCCAMLPCVSAIIDAVKTHFADLTSACGLERQVLRPSEQVLNEWAKLPPWQGGWSPFTSVVVCWDLDRQDTAGGAARHDQSRCFSRLNNEAV